MEHSFFGGPVCRVPDGAVCQAMHRTKPGCSTCAATQRCLTVSGPPFNWARMIEVSQDMPVEDASKEWCEDQSPYQAVARIRLPRQDA